MDLDMHSCPACGFDGLDEKPWVDDRPSDSICPSCGIQFGLDDVDVEDDRDRAAMHALWRERWIAGGCRWYSRTRHPPPGWNATDQLKRVHGR
jgi:hypothetical protein